MKKLMRNLNVLLALSLVIANVLFVGGYTGTPDGEGGVEIYSIADDIEIH